MPPRKKTATKADTAANLGFEAKLWLATDKLRNNMDAAESKHVVLGLTFLKTISLSACGSGCIVAWPAGFYHVAQRKTNSPRANFLGGGRPLSRSKFREVQSKRLQ